MTTVTFKASGKVVVWNTDYETLLEFAEDQDLNVSFGCREGNCHTCACGLIKGEVEYIEEPALEPDDGSILICCSIPKTNIEIDL